MKVAKELEDSWCFEADPLGIKGVLLSDEIERFAIDFDLISPFNSKQLKPAGYELTIGKDYNMGGKFGKLEKSPNKDTIKLQPFEVVILSTNEIINLPRFLIARWNLRVIWAYQGLLWLGALQVDPGYVGQLFCPVFNLSSKPIDLRLNERIALMDFVTTTPFNDKSKEHIYDRPPKRKTIKDYNNELESALMTEAGKKLHDITKDMDTFKKNIGTRIDKSSEIIENKVNKSETKMENLIIIFLMSITILIAVLAILFTSNPETVSSPPIWIYFSVTFSIIAIILSGNFYFRNNKSSHFDYNKSSHIEESKIIMNEIKQIKKFNNLYFIIIFLLLVIIAVICWRIIQW